MARYPRSQVDEVLARLSIPRWVDRVTAEPTFDHEGEMAIDVLVIVCDGEWDVFWDGARLNEVVRRIHDALVAHGIKAWPFVNFVSADEIDAK